MSSHNVEQYGTGGGGGADQQYTDGATQSTPVGTVALGKNPSNILHALPLSANGNLNINIAEGGGSGGTSQTDKTGFTEGAGIMTPAGGVYNDTISSDPTEDQAAALRITAKRGLHVNLRNASGTEIGTASNPARTDPTGTTTQPISATSLPLPTGAATAAKQPALGTAGTPSSDVLTIQGAASMTAVKTDGSGVTQPVSGTVTSNAGTGNFGANITQVGGSAVSLGQKTMANSFPVAWASDQTPVPDTSQAISISSSGTSVTATGLNYATVAGVVLTSLGTGGTIQFEASVDGSTWVSVNALPVPSGAFVTSTSATGTWIINLAGFTSFRVRASALTSGTISGTIRIGCALGSLNLAGPLPAGSAVIGSLTANQSVNVAQLAGTTTDTNSGSKTAGTLRVVLATDQPQLTNKLLVTPDANSAVNVSQLNGTTTDTNSGNKSAGTLRVVLATDQPQLTNKLLVTPDANSAVNVAQIGGSTVSTAASGVQKVGIVGNGGATVDSTVGAGTAPTNQIVVGQVYNTTAPAPTNGQAMALQSDQAGNLLLAPGMATATLSAWNSGTSLNATQTIFTHSGVPAVLVQLTQTTTLTAGAVTFEVTFDDSNWSTISADAVIDPTSTTQATVSLPYTVQASTNKTFLLLMKGAQGLRAKLSTQITGSGTVTPNYALLAYPGVQQSVLGAGSATIGSLAANQSMNVAQVAGTTTDTNSGNKSAGTQRVVLATDQPQLTNALKVDGSAVNQPVVGNVASGSSDSGNPIKNGGVAHTTNPTAVSDGQRVNCFRDKVGRQVVMLNQCRDLVAIQQTTITSSTSETTIVSAAGSGVFADLTQLVITNSSATALIVTLKDSTAGTTRGIYALAANGGIVMDFTTPFPQASANNNWTLTCGTSVASIYVVAVYAKNV